MDIYDEITKRIDGYYADLKKSHPFYRAIFDGSLEAATLQIYLYNIKFSLASTIVQCAIGAKTCSTINEPKLQAFFEHKIKEESGHDQWAQEDLDRLASHYSLAASPSTLTSEIRKFVDYNTELVRTDPRLYLLYMLFAEYFTVIAAPECLEAIENKCHINKSLLSVLGKHAELDKDHVEEWRNVVRDCEVDMLSLYPQAIMVLDKIMHNYDAFWDFLGESNKLHAKHAS